MTAPQIRLTLDAAPPDYQPGERITGRYFVDSTHAWAARAAELSILWYTAGKGEEDFAVHHFERLVDDPARPLDLRTPHRFDIALPPSPLSYDGVIVKVCWCVRLRLFLPQGQETVAEASFRLGDVPSPAVQGAEEISNSADLEARDGQPRSGEAPEIPRAVGP